MRGPLGGKGGGGPACRMAQAQEEMARGQREEEVNAEAERHRERRRWAQRESQELQKQLNSIQQAKAANIAGGEVRPERVSPFDQSPGYSVEIRG